MTLPCDTSFFSPLVQLLHKLFIAMSNSGVVTTGEWQEQNHDTGHLNSSDWACVKPQNVRADKKNQAKQRAMLGLHGKILAVEGCRDGLCEKRPGATLCQTDPVPPGSHRFTSGHSWAQQPSWLCPWGSIFKNTLKKKHCAAAVTQRSEKKTTCDKQPCRH